MQGGVPMQKGPGYKRQVGQLVMVAGAATATAAAGGGEAGDTTTGSTKGASYKA